MTEDDRSEADESRADAGEDAAEPADVHTKPRRRRWPWIVGGILVSPFVILALWTVFSLNYVYSSGDRAGYVQKFSRKGWVCKTWEGELAMVNVPGALQERFEFTVRNDSVAALIQQSMGKQVSITYEEHVGVPFSCLGDTKYFVVGVRTL